MRQVPCNQSREQSAQHAKRDRNGPVPGCQQRIGSMKPESRVVVCFAAQIPLPPVQASNPGSGARANWDQRVGQRSMPRVNGRIQDIRENTP
ncbi:MAG: hypothetical protein J0L64_00045 [Acidobacteria bacterium]|nr:hypothetical protein [Acidobacteriota bacterium]